MKPMKKGMGQSFRNLVAAGRDRWKDLIPYCGGGRYSSRRYDSHGHSVRRGKEWRRPNAKNLAQLEERVTDHIRQGISRGILKAEVCSNAVTKEALARHFNVPEHAIYQVLQRLKVKGLLTTKEDQAAHDTPRNPMFWGSDSSWDPSRWYIRFDRWLVAA